MKRTKQFIQTHPILMLAYVRAFRRKPGEGMRQERVAWSRIMAVAFAGMLVMMFAATNAESTEGTTRYLKSVNFSYLVIQKGARSSIDTSSVPPAALDVFRKHHVNAVGLTYYWSRLRGRDVLWQSYRANGPTEPLIEAGRQIRDQDEAVLDKDLATAIGVDLNSRIGVAGYHFTVVGTTRQTGSFGKEQVFISQKAMNSLYGTPIYNGIAVQGMSRSELNLLLRPWAQKVDLITKEEFINGNLAYWERNVSSLILTIIGVVFVLTLAGLLWLPGFQIRLQRRTLALLRALGGSRVQVGAGEALAMLMLGLTGFVLAMPLAIAAISLTNFTTPGFHASLTANNILMALAVIFVAVAVSTASAFWRSSRTPPIVAING